MSKMQALESRLSIEFLKTSINDYKELFLAPLKSPASSNNERRSSAMLLQAQDRSSHVSYQSRYSNLKTKEVIVLKTENEEKGEVRDLAKFVTQLT